MDEKAQTLIDRIKPMFRELLLMDIKDEFPKFVPSPEQRKRINDAADEWMDNSLFHDCINEITAELAGELELWKY